jgi:hypothetical protein
VGRHHFNRDRRAIVRYRTISIALDASTTRYKPDSRGHRFASQSALDNTTMDDSTQSVLAFVAFTSSRDAEMVRQTTTLTAALLSSLDFVSRVVGRRCSESSLRITGVRAQVPSELAPRSNDITCRHFFLACSFLCHDTFGLGAENCSPARLSLTVKTRAPLPTSSRRTSMD